MKWVRLGRWVLSSFFFFTSGSDASLRNRDSAAWFDGVDEDWGDGGSGFSWKASEDRTEKRGRHVFWVFLVLLPLAGQSIKSRARSLRFLLCPRASREGKSKFRGCIPVLIGCMKSTSYTFLFLAVFGLNPDDCPDKVLRIHLAFLVSLYYVSILGKILNRSLICCLITNRNIF